MVVSDIIKNKPYLAWDVKDISVLSDESVLEHVLNYGNWEDVQVLCKTVGWERVSVLFHKTLQGKRTNYTPEIEAFFKRYFDVSHAHRHS